MNLGSLKAAGESLRSKSPRGTLALWFGIAVLGLWLFVAMAGPFLAPHDPADILSAQSFSYPPEAGFLGTDYLGRDVLSRLLYGARMTLGLALVASVLTLLAGVTLGFASAVLSGWCDQVLSRIADAFLSFPPLVLALIVISGLGTTLPVVVLTVVLAEATRVFRVSRALALNLTRQEFVDAARSRGEGLCWIIFQEILPNLTGPLLAEFGLRYIYAILMISSLSFLGLGILPPTADWGVMVRENIQGLYQGSPAVIVPAAAIGSIAISVNLIVDWLVARGNVLVPKEMLG